MIWLLFKFVLHPLADPPGSQGRLLQWHPGACESKRKALPAYCPDLLARFCKESSLSKQEMLPDVGKRFFAIYLSPLPSEKTQRVEITWTSVRGRRIWPYAASQSCCRSLFVIICAGGWLVSPGAVRHKGF